MYCMDTVQAPAPSPAYGSVDWCVAYSGLSRATIYRAFEAGTLKSYKVGCRRLIKVVELDEMITANLA